MRRQGSGLSGVVVVDKPAGPTSHDVVDHVRRKLGVGRAGHTGTLDPFATGVLPVCVGKATRLARFLAAGEKVYRATVRLGFATTTDDLHGEPLGEPLTASPEPAAVAAACRALAGTRLQAPPAYSAKRVEGRRSYELARRGIAVEPRVVAVTLHSIELLAVDGERVEIEVRCSPGTYIRALARDLGEALATGGHLVTLRRMRSGAFGLERAVGWDAPFEDALTPLSQLLPEIPAAVLTDSGVEALRHGRDLPRDLVRSGFPDAPVPRMRVLDSSGALLGLAVPRGFGRAGPGLSIEPVLHPDVVLVD